MPMSSLPSPCRRSDAGVPHSGQGGRGRGGGPPLIILNILNRAGARPAGSVGADPRDPWDPAWDQAAPALFSIINKSRGDAGSLGFCKGWGGSARDPAGS